MKDETIEEIIDLYDKAQEEFRTTKEKDYWQGRKDGLRLALALIQPEETHWNLLNKSSHGFQVEEREQYKNFVEDIYYNVCDLIYCIRHKEKLHPMTISNIQNWIGTYMNEEHKKSDFVKPAPDAINPFK